MLTTLFDPYLQNGMKFFIIIAKLQELVFSNSKFYNALWYQDLLEQAYELDNKRFCRMFNSKKNKGISFQLLIIKELRERYCEWCIN